MEIRIQDKNALSKEWQKGFDKIGDILKLNQDIAYALGYNAAMDNFKDQSFAVQCEENRFDMEGWKARALQAEKRLLCPECNQPL